MSTARISEIGAQIVDLRVRAQKSEAAAYAAGLNHGLAESHQRAANELWRQVHDLEARRANLTAGLVEDFGAPKPEPVRPVPAKPVEKRAQQPAASLATMPDVVPYPFNLSREERKQLNATQAAEIAVWMVDVSKGRVDDDLLGALALAFVATEWATDRVRALEDRISDLEMALAKRASSAGTKKLDALAARVAELEAGGVIYCGVYQRSGVTYRKGSLVTADGSGWIALRQTKEGEAPGASTAWQLAIKRGKDGKDLRT